MLCHRQSDSLGDAIHERPPWEAYATLLTPLGYGYPRYYPQAGNSQHEIAIGDVAFFEPGGQYIRILNVFQPATSAVNTCFGITDPFERLNIDDFAIEDLTLQMPLVLGSEGVTAVPEKGWDISSNSKLYLHSKLDYAAFMMLPTRTVKVQKLHAPEGTIESFVSRNHLYWNRLGADFHIGQRQNEVFFVTGWMKATHWLGGVCHAGARDRTFTFDRYGLVKVSEGPSSFWWARCDPCENYNGRMGLPMEQSSDYKNCIFVGYHNPKITMMKRLSYLLRNLSPKFLDRETMNMRRREQRGAHDNSKTSNTSVEGEVNASAAGTSDASARDSCTQP